jgi:hypothetical protein
MSCNLPGADTKIYFKTYNKIFTQARIGHHYNTPRSHIKLTQQYYSIKYEDLSV